MPFLVVAGASEEDVNNQADFIMGENATIHDAGIETVELFQFNKSQAVTAPIAAFSANVAGASVWVRWVRYSPAPA